MNHPEVVAKFRCESCGVSLCPSCLYGESGRHYRCQSCDERARSTKSDETPTDRALKKLVVASTMPACFLGYFLWWRKGRDWSRVWGFQWAGASIIGALGSGTLFEAIGIPSAFAFLSMIIGYLYFLRRRIESARTLEPREDLVSTFE